MLTRVLQISVLSFVTVLTLITTAWGTLAMGYRLPFDGSARYAVCALFAVVGVLTVRWLWRTRRVRVMLPFALAFGGLLGWWSTLDPPSDGNWSPDVARQTTGQIDGDTLQLSDVRDFRWRRDGTFVEDWTTQTYDLNQLTTTDLFLSYWAGPQMAHFVLSFGFADGRYLAWTVEVRREVDGGFSPVADAFKTNTLVILGTTERDVIGLRTNIRQEDVRLFRLSTDPADARHLLEEYVRDANQLAQTPQWYNSLSTNCTTVVVKMMRAIGRALPLDWRIILNGYLPEYAYAQGALNTTYSIEALRDLGRVSPKGQAHGLEIGFSDAIRVGVPAP